jgi:hypothetical protein
MGTILPFTTERRERQTAGRTEPGVCEIVIFPGVRIERHDWTRGPDASEPSSGSGKLDGTNGRRRSRKSS